MRHRTLPLAAALLLVMLHTTAAVAAKRVSADASAALNVSALRPSSTAVAAVVLDVHPGLHAQSHTPSDASAIKLEVKPDANPAVDFGTPVYPPGEEKEYAALGKLNVYTGKVVIYLPVRVKPDAPAGPVHLSGRLTLQACNENTCFPPEHPTFAIDTQVVAPGTVVTPANAELFAGAPPALMNGSAPATTEPSPAVPTTAPAVTMDVPTDADTQVSLFGHSFNLKSKGFLVSVLVAFGAGIIFNVVPCVLPVLPLKAIGFYEASQHNRARTLLLGFAFSCGLVAVFAALGLVILFSKSVFGSQIQWGQQFSHPWFVWGVAVVLALLGLGMFGAFSVNLPTSVYGMDFRHDTISGNIMWGALTAVLSTPCTAPLFPPVLAYSLGLPRVEGFLLVSMVGVGMASPYFFLSAFPELARKFPRTGPVSELVKQMMGFLMLGSAAFFAGLELVGEPNQWWVVFAVAVWACLYLVIRTPQVMKSAASLYVSTGLAVAIAGGMLVLTLGLTAAQDVKWQPYSPEALAVARRADKTVLIDFTASWCLNCKLVERTVYRDSRTVDFLRSHGVVTMKADLSNSDAVGYPLLNDLGANGIPYTAVYLPHADKPVGLASIYTTDTLLSVLDLDGGKPVAMAQ